MTLGKIGTTIGKEIIAWTRTGDKGLLAMKPIKVNTKSLGYIHPSGEISFQSGDAALNYAKNRCIRALKTDSPFERAVVIKDNVVLKEIDGGADEIVLDGICDKIFKDSVFVHGHPDNMPFLSHPDILTMISEKMKSIMAITEDGKFTAFTRKPNQWFRFKDGACSIDGMSQARINELGGDLISQEAKILASSIPLYDRKLMENIILASNSSESYAKRYIFDSDKIKYAQKVMEKALNDQKISARVVKACDILCKKRNLLMDKFFQNVANKYEFKYTKSL